MGNNPRLSLLEEAVARTKLPWYLASAIITIVLILFLLLAAYLDGPLSQLTDWPYLRGPLLPLSIVVYVLAIFPLMGRLRTRAILSLEPLLQKPVTGSTIVGDIFWSRKRWELLSMLAGLLFFIALSQPWEWVENRPIGIYAAIVDALMFGILGMLVFSGLSGTFRISVMARRYLKIDIFNSGELVPVANWCLGMSMAFVGGTSISIVFQDIDNLRHWQTLVLYTGLILVALIIFFLSMWNVHAAIAREKRAELALIRKKLDRGFQELRRKKIPDSSPISEDPMYNAITAWAAYEQRIQQVPEWPYDARIVRRLAASVMAPSLVYLIRYLLGIRM